jgi:hypothetical protein
MLLRAYCSVLLSIQSAIRRPLRDLSRTEGTDGDVAYILDEQENRCS